MARVRTFIHSSNEWEIDVGVVARVTSTKKKRRCFVCNEEDHLTIVSPSRVVLPEEVSCFRCGEQETRK